MMASSMERSCASSRMRTPRAGGSIGGVIGTSILPFILSTAPPGMLSFLILILAPVAKTGTMLVHGSHASPSPSWSLSACEVFGSVGQLSSRSHTPSPSLSVARTSAGQVALVPLLCSAGSQTPVEDRQMAVPGWNASGGQATDEPSQLSATSHGPATGRQTAVLFASAGHAALVPVQVSAGSQTPAEARHSTVAGSKASGGQSLLTPSQLSATSHTPAAGRHTAVLLASAGQPALVPVQVSATSQAPAAARQTVPLLAGSGGWMQRPLASQLSAVQPLPSPAHAGPVAAGVPPHRPTWQRSVTVQPLPSSQGVPSVTSVPVHAPP